VALYLGALSVELYDYFDLLADQCSSKVEISSVPAFEEGRADLWLA
jgi:hypothetical protein